MLRVDARDERLAAELLGELEVEVELQVVADLETAGGMLTYPRDRDTLEGARQLGGRTEPLVVLRHADARSRKEWKGDYRERTLTEKGELQAHQLSPTLASYGVERLVWYQEYPDIRDAIDEEKRIKRWRRAWKLKLIEGFNPAWRDLYEEIGH